MESEAAHARAVIMRDARNGEDCATAERGWLDWLADCGVPAITGVDTRALVRHIRDRGAMRGGIFPAELPESEARERVAAEPSMTRRRLRPHGDPGGAGRDRRRRPAHRRHRHRDQALDRAPVPRAGLPGDAAALRHERRGRAGPRSRPALPRQRARRSGGARLRRRHGPRRDRQEAGLRHLPRPPADVPGDRPRDLQAPVRAPRQPTTRSRSWRAAASTSPPRTTASPSPAPAAPSGSRATSRSAGRPTSASPSSRT